MDKISPIKENILHFIDNQRIKKEEFYEKTQIASSNFKGSGLKSEIGGDKIVKILSAFPEINPEWLLTGRGKMLKETAKKEVVKSYPKPSKEPKKLPKLPIDAYAGLGAGEFVLSENDIEEYYTVPEFSNADFLIPVKGSSMQPKYNGGDVLACKHIHSYDWLQWGVPHVIHIKERGVVVKRVYKTNNEDSIELKSDNERYESFCIEKKDIINISIVIGAIRVE